MEEFETYADVIDSWNISSEKAGGKSLTDYIKDNNIKIKEIDMDPLGDLGRALSSKAHGGSVGIEVLFNPKRKEFKKGGRGRQDRMGGTMEQTAAELRAAAPDQFAGGMNISHGGGNGGTGGNNNLVDTTPIITDATKTGLLELGAKKLGISQYLHPALMMKGFYDQLKNPTIKDEDVTLGKTSEVISNLPGDNLFAEIGEKQTKYLNEPITQKNLKDSSFGLTTQQVFENMPKYEDKPWLGKNQEPTSADEFNEYLNSIGIKDKSQMVVGETQMSKDGGRVGFVNGGWAEGLEGEALSIYNSMNAYGASDAEIQSKLQGQDLWSPDGISTGGEQVTGIINQNIGGGGGGGGIGGGGKFGNLDTSQSKTFTKDVWSEIGPGKYDWVETDVTGYMNPTSKNWQTLEGKNINHGGINFKPAFAGILEALGAGDKINLDDYGGRKPGSIKGTFTDGFNFKNPFRRQQATMAQINAMNKKAWNDLQIQKELEAKKKLEAEIAANQPQWHTQGGQDPSGRGNVTSSSGDVYGGAAYGYNEAEEKSDYYKRGGLATMFTRRR